MYCSHGRSRSGSAASTGSSSTSARSGWPPASSAPTRISVSWRFSSSSLATAAAAHGFVTPRRQRPAPPQFPGRLRPGQRLAGLSGRQQLTGLSHQRGEPHRVNLLSGDHQPVTAGFEDQPPSRPAAAPLWFEEPAQPVQMRVQRRLRPGRTPIPPHRLNQLTDINPPPRINQQPASNRPRIGPPGARTWLSSVTSTGPRSRNRSVSRSDADRTQPLPQPANDDFAWPARIAPVVRRQLSLAGKAGGGVFQYGRLQGLARLDRQQHGQADQDDHQDAEDAPRRPGRGAGGG